MDGKEKILKFLKRHKVGVLSYSSKDGRPSGATMVYAVRDGFSLLMVSNTPTRKYLKLKEKNPVAVTIGVDWDELQTVQYEGTAKIWKDKKSVEQKRAELLKKMPEMKSHVGAPDEFYIEIKPTWIRLTDFSKQPPETTVLEF